MSNINNSTFLGNYKTNTYHNQNDKLPKFKEPVLICYSLSTDTHTIKYYGCGTCILDKNNLIRWIDLIYGNEITNIFELYWIDFKSCFGNLDPTRFKYK